MSFQSQISLIDLSKQFNFEIDEDIKKKICFDETLIVSCAHCEGHYENAFNDDTSDSEWTCTTESSESKVSVQKKEEKGDVKEKQEETPSTKEDVDEGENDFHFYFFPDCDKPISPTIDDKASLVIVDGFPKINKKSAPTVCTCELDKSGECPCHLKVPCECGAKTLHECICHQIDNICICEDTPQLKCKCKPKNVCLCHPDGIPQPVCTCANIEKPCICQRDKFPYPICVCEHKPNMKSQNKNSDEIEEETEESNELESTKQPCTCQKPLPKKICFCLKGKKCTCEKDKCICDVLPTCLCQASEDEQIICKDDDSKSICICPVEPQCKCYSKSPNDCDCFPKPVPDCTCGNPEECICQKTCECKEPCLCDTMPVKANICTCDDIKSDDLIASDSKEDTRKLKKIRAGKHGYRWCHEVDPKHTFFDYAYDRHSKISHKEQEKEKLKILGLYEEPKHVDNESATKHRDAPVYKKKVRKPSIDCCSAVGGISISVETLGEDKDKFLIQVVSNASKEGAKTGSKLVSIIDCNLHTLEENRAEHITKKDLTKEHRSYMTICESGYYNKVTRICGERHFVKRLYHSFEKARNFLLEGANVVLLRYFGISRFCGHVKTDTVLINGTICESVYVCQGVSQAIVNGKPLFVCKVERHIIEPSGCVHQTLTVLTLKGYIVSHEWADSSYIFHINPLLRVVPERDEIEPHEPLREKWRSDLQLLSDYLDFKSTRSSEGARYVSESGELTGVIRDYLQTLLMIRPHDAIHFTRHYFSSALSALDLPHNEYFDPCSKHVRYYFFEE